MSFITENLNESQKELKLYNMNSSSTLVFRQLENLSQLLI